MLAKRSRLRDKYEAYKFKSSSMDALGDFFYAEVIDLIAQLHTLHDNIKAAAKKVKEAQQAHRHIEKGLAEAQYIEFAHAITKARSLLHFCRLQAHKYIALNPDIKKRVQLLDELSLTESEFHTTDESTPVPMVKAGDDVIDIYEKLMSQLDKKIRDQMYSLGLKIEKSPPPSLYSRRPQETDSPLSVIYLFEKAASLGHMEALRKMITINLQRRQFKLAEHFLKALLKSNEGIEPKDFYIYSLLRLRKQDFEIAARSLCEAAIRGFPHAIQAIGTIDHTHAISRQPQLSPAGDSKRSPTDIFKYRPHDSKRPLSETAILKKRSHPVLPMPCKTTTVEETADSKNIFDDFRHLAPTIEERAIQQAIQSHYKKLTDLIALLDKEESIHNPLFFSTLYYHTLRYFICANMYLWPGQFAPLRHHLAHPMMYGLEGEDAESRIRLVTYVKKLIEIADGNPLNEDVVRYSDCLTELHPQKDVRMTVDGFKKRLIEINTISKNKTSYTEKEFCRLTMLLFSCAQLVFPLEKNYFIGIFLAKCREEIRNQLCHVGLLDKPALNHNILQLASMAKTLLQELKALDPSKASLGSAALDKMHCRWFRFHPAHPSATFAACPTSEAVSASRCIA